MKNTFRILFTAIYLSITVLSADPDGIVSLNEITMEAQEDFYDLFYQLQDMDIIPKNLNLSSPFISQNGATLLTVLDLIQQNPDVSPEKNQHTKNFFQKLEQINYIELRKVIGKFNKIETLAEQDKAKVLTTLHELYTFTSNSVEQNSEYPFRKIISHIFLYLSFLNKSNFSHEERVNMFGLFMDKQYQELLRVKDLYSSCTTKAKEIKALTTILKSYSIQKSNLKRILIKTTVTAGAIAAAVLAAWLIYKYVFPYLYKKLKKEVGLREDLSIFDGLEAKVDKFLAKIGIQTFSDSDVEAARKKITDASDDEIKFILDCQKPKSVQVNEGTSEAAAKAPTHITPSHARDKILSSDQRTICVYANLLEITATFKTYAQALASGALSGVVDNKDKLKKLLPNLLAEENIGSILKDFLTPILKLLYDIKFTIIRQVIRVDPSQAPASTAPPEHDTHITSGQPESGRHRSNSMPGTDRPAPRS